MSTQTATAGAPSTVTTASNYHDYVNPQWVTLLNLLGMNVEYERCFGCELFTKDGRAILDFSIGLLRPQHRAQPSIRNSGVEGRNG